MVILIGQSDNYETFRGIITCLFNYISIIHIRAHNSISNYQATLKSHSGKFNFKCKCIARFSRPLNFSNSNNFLQSFPSLNL